MNHSFFSKLARTAASALAFAVAAGVHALTLDELKQMVKELEAIAVKHPDYAYPIECEIVDRPVINAHATAIYKGEGEKPQAKMVVFTGLVDFMNDDKDLIRAVVAHEVSHLACGHVSPSEPVARDLSQFWTRTQELEADATGAMLLQRSGHSKDHMAQMLLKLDEARGRTGSWI
ncbi:MAG: M48 family metalloprotease, partial [Fimbriimonadaceae bacterium]|nr:M48 family metalloprotease [Fimbriimonadaceae bacterium]